MEEKGISWFDYDKNAEVKYSRLALANASGDAEDYAKIIISAPGKPVIDIEMNAIDAFAPKLMKICGTKGTFYCDTAKYEMKYIVDGENPERPVVFEALKDADGMPAYCSEKLEVHEESGEFEGTPFTTAVYSFYSMLYNTLKNGAPLEVTPETAARVIGIIEKVHADNPLPVRY